MIKSKPALTAAQYNVMSYFPQDKGQFTHYELFHNLALKNISLKTNKYVSEHQRYESIVFPDGSIHALLELPFDEYAQVAVSELNEDGSIEITEEIQRQIDSKYNPFHSVSNCKEDIYYDRKEDPVTTNQKAKHNASAAGKSKPKLSLVK